MLHWRSRELDEIAKSTPHHPARQAKMAGPHRPRVVFGIFFGCITLEIDREYQRIIPLII